MIINYADDNAHDNGGDDQCYRNKTKNIVTMCAYP